MRKTLTEWALLSLVITSAIQSQALAPELVSIENKQKSILYHQLLNFIEQARPHHHVFFTDFDDFWPKPFERLPFQWYGQAVYVLPIGTPNMYVVPLRSAS